MCVCVLSTLKWIDFRTLGVHVGVVQRDARGVADRRRRRRSLGVRGCRLPGGGDGAGVEAQIRESGRGVAVGGGGGAIAQVVQVHEPLGPESPADALAVHGQVDQLACVGHM